MAKGRNRNKKKNRNIINVPSNMEISFIKNSKHLTDEMKEHLIILCKGNQIIKDKCLKSLRMMDSDNVIQDLSVMGIDGVPEITPMINALDIFVPHIEDDNNDFYVTDVVSQHDDDEWLQIHSGVKFSEAFIYVFYMENIGKKFTHIYAKSPDRQFGANGKKHWAFTSDIIDEIVE